MKGDRWDSNPQPSEPQSDAPPLSYDHHALLARPAGLEPTTLDLEGPCSVQLSYERLP